jgi:iron complex transport system permease protein
LTRGHQTLLLSLTPLVVLIAGLLALAIGMPRVDLGTAITTPDSWQRQAVLELQLPRILQGLGVGATLSLVGATLQALLRNPLADPFVLGVSGGAALGSASSALLGTVLGLGTGLAIAPLGGFLGALGALAIVLTLGAERGIPSPLRMLLVGVVVNALAGAALMVLSALGDPALVQRTMLRLMGTLGADPSEPALLWVVLSAAAFSLLTLLPSSRALDLLALGDDGAHSVGLDPERLRRRLLITLSLPIGAVVAVTGMIGFVGLLVPHALRLVVGPSHRLLLPLSAATGGAFVALSDATVSALAEPLGTELPVGVLTALIGGPVFLALLRTRTSEAR